MLKGKVYVVILNVLILLFYIVYVFLMNLLIMNDIEFYLLEIFILNFRLWRKDMKLYSVYMKMIVENVF